MVHGKLENEKMDSFSDVYYISIYRYLPSGNANSFDGKWTIEIGDLNIIQW